jgi:hypothetical protein
MIDERRQITDSERRQRGQRHRRAMQGQRYVASIQMIIDGIHCARLSEKRRAVEAKLSSYVESPRHDTVVDEKVEAVLLLNVLRQALGNCQSETVEAGYQALHTFAFFGAVGDGVDGDGGGLQGFL